MEHYRTLNILDALDGIALFVFLWITTAHQHHTYCCTWVEFYGTLVKVALCHTFKQVNYVALQSQHHTLSLRVAHTAVILNYVWLWLLAWSISAVDKSEEDESLVVDAVGSQSLNSRTDDAVLNLLHPLLCGKRHRCNTTHTTGVQTSVMLADTLVVLSLGQDLVVFTISKYEYRALYTAHELLDDHAT